MLVQTFVSAYLDQMVTKPFCISFNESQDQGSSLSKISISNKRE